MKTANNKRVSFPAANHSSGGSPLKQIAIKSFLNSNDSRRLQNKFLEKSRPTADNLQSSYQGRNPDLRWSHVENIVSSATRCVARFDVRQHLVDGLFRPDDSCKLVRRRQLEVPRSSRIPLYPYVPSTPKKNILSNYEMSKINEVLCYPMTESQLSDWNQPPSPTSQLSTLAPLYSAPPEESQEEARTSSLENECGSSTPRSSPTLSPSVRSVTSRNPDEIDDEAPARKAARFLAQKLGAKRESAVLDVETLHRVSDSGESRVPSRSTDGRESIRRRSRIPVRVSKIPITESGPPPKRAKYIPRSMNRSTQTSPVRSSESSQSKITESSDSEPFDIDAKIAEILARPSPEGLVRTASWDSTDELFAKLSPISIPSILDEISTDYSDDPERSPRSEPSASSGSDPASPWGELETGSPEPFAFCSPESYVPSPEPFESQSPEDIESQSPERFRSPSPDTSSPELFEAGSPESFTRWSPEAFEFRSPEQFRRHCRETSRSRDKVPRRPSTGGSRREPTAYSERAPAAHSKRSYATHSEHSSTARARHPSVDYSRRPSADYSRSSSSNYRRRSPVTYTRRSHEASAAPSASVARSTSRFTTSHREDFRKPDVPPSNRKHRAPPPMSARPRYDVRSEREHQPERRAKSVSIKRATKLEKSPYV